MLQRQQLRQSLLARRHALASNIQQSAAQQLAAILIQSPLFLTSQHIAAYYAVNKEMDPAPLLQNIHTQNKLCYLPILTGQRLQFARYLPNEPLQPNRYNIPEPVNQDRIAPTKLDLVLLPLIGFDLQGNRLGTGGGYYDRTFAFLQPQKRPAKPYLLGLAYEWQRIEALPAEAWDIRLDAIITEEQIYVASGSD